MSSRGYKQYCAFARALDVVGDRWSLLVVRNLLLGGQRFGQLREGLPGVASNMLSGRLKMLTEQGVVRLDAGLYELTPMGRELEGAVFALADWGERHLMGPPKEEDRMRVRYAVTSMRRKMRPVDALARVEVRIDGAWFSFVCGPEPIVTQGRCPGADASVTIGIVPMRDLFFRGDAVDAWLERDDVEWEGDAQAVRVMCEGLGIG